jgi:hypothetical protein
MSFFSFLISVPENVLCDLPLAVSELKEDEGSTETVKEYHTNNRIRQEISSQYFLFMSQNIATCPTTFSNPVDIHQVHSEYMFLISYIRL